MGSRRFSDALRALLPGERTPSHEYLDAFRRMAALVLRRSTWVIAGARHRFTEVEVYWNGRAHRDVFAHDDPERREFARWSHHRTGGEYRGGSFKGLDVAIGAPDVRAGILVRGIERLDGDRTLIDGPSLCVDHLLALTGSRDVRSLATSFDRSVDACDVGESPSYIEVEDRDSDVVGVFESPRVGLSLSRGVTPARLRFIAAPYRFLSEPARIKKGRMHLVVSLHRQRTPHAQIVALTGSSSSQVARWCAHYDEGRAMRPEGFSRELRRTELCCLFGACERLLPESALRGAQA